MLQEVVVKCVEYMRKRESGPDRPNRAAIQVDGNKVDQTIKNVKNGKFAGQSASDD